MAEKQVSRVGSLNSHRLFILAEELDALPTVSDLAKETFPGKQKPTMRLLFTQ